MSKFYFKPLLCISILAITSACSQDVADQPVSPGNVTSKKTHRVSLEDALERSKVFQDGLNGGLGTRGMQSSDIKSVEYLSSGVKTRSAVVDTLFYLVNYKDKQGFMLLSADERMLPVYAMSDEGQLNLSDTIYNEALCAFFNLAKADALRITNLLDTTKFEGTIDKDPFDYTYDRSVQPMFSKNLRLIGQGSPFNKYCYTTTGEKAVAGCGPVAVASLLAYYKTPGQIRGRAIEWTAINENIKNDDFYHLIWEIGQEDYLNAEYGTNSTSCSTSSICNSFPKLGLQPSNLVRFNDINAAKALENNPILVCGAHPKGGHAWIMDGYIRYGALHHLSTVPEPGRSYPYFFFHCCWGWDNSANGYYYYKSKNAIDGTADMLDKDDNKYYNSIYYDNLKMIYSFTKKQI